MTSSFQNPLPWSIEAFRPYMTYEVLQEAVAVLRTYEGCSTNFSRRESAEMIQSLQRRTGLPWIAERKVQFGIHINTEGSIFRRMKRIFTSFYLLDNESYENENLVKLTDFGKKLSAGLLSKEEFYSKLIIRYSYPHSAYEDNIKAWNSHGPFFPMKFITDTMFEVEQLNIPGYSGIKVKEFAALIHPIAQDITPQKAAQILQNHYRLGNSVSHTRVDSVDRKISDLFGFLVEIKVLIKNGNATRANRDSSVYLEMNRSLTGKVKKQ